MATAGVTLSIKNLFGITPTTIYGNKVPLDEPAPVPYGAARRSGITAAVSRPGVSPPEKDPTTPRQAGYRIPRIIATSRPPSRPAWNYRRHRNHRRFRASRPGTTVAVSPGILLAAPIR